MFDRKKQKYSLYLSNFSHHKKSEHNHKAKKAVRRRFGKINGLYLLSALTQLFLGTIVVGIALVGLITPIFLAIFMTILGSVSTMTGLYFLYVIFGKNNAYDTLVKKGIRDMFVNRN